jgi:hypothetical protein
MSGRQVDTQRPSAPAIEVHVGGTKWFAVEITGSGRHRPFGQAASFERWSAGTMSAGTQCAPPHAGLQAGNAFGSATAGPFHGHVKMSGGFFGWSHASEHAPVGAIGSLAVGSKQGAHFSFAAHTSVGKSAAFAATLGRQVLTQRPSAPAIDAQVFGTKLLADAMTWSGAQKPGAPSFPLHGLKSDR